MAAISVGTTATLLLAYRPSRQSAIIQNAGANPIYVDFGDSPTVAGGVSIPAGSALTLGDTTEAVYGIVAAATETARVIQEGL